MGSKSIILLLLVFTAVAAITLSHLEQFISTYELIELEVNVIATEAYSYGSPKSADPDHDTIRIRFRTFGNLVEFVAPKSTVHQLHGAKLEIRGLKGPHHVVVHDFSPRFYELKRPGFSAFGFLVDDGQFIGTVRVGNVTYYIEPAPTYFKGAKKLPRFTSVVYRESDIKHPHREGCVRYPRESGSPLADMDSLAFGSGASRDFDFGSEPSSDSGNPKLVACEIELVGDVSLLKWWDYDYNMTAGYMFLHAKYVDGLFQRLNLGNFTVRIVVKDIVIFSSEYDRGYPFYPHTTDFEEFINQFSRMANTHCLSICMCARAFDSRVIGLAFMAQLNKPYYGGICSLPSSNSYLSDRVVSHNKAVITVVNMKGLPIPLGVTLRTFAHELGHSFGSRHDPEHNLTCAPGGRLGFYLMYSLSQRSGVLSEQFSPCSVRNMSQIVNNRFRCLVPVVAVCGNGIREPSEDCDCGTATTCELVDKCCTPKGGLDGSVECSYRRDLGYTCSQHEDACCTNECTIDVSGRQCSTGAGGCLIGYCNGTFKSCPEVSFAPDGTPCMESSRTCSHGSCNSTVCADNGLLDCACEGQDSCSVCCLNGAECVPASKLGFGQRTDLKLHYGSVCGPSQQCDADGECVFVGQAAPDSTSGWLYYVPYVALSVSFFIILGTLAYLIFRNRAGQRSGPPPRRQTQVFSVS